MSSYFLDKETAKKAITIALASLEMAVEMGVAKRPHFHIVVLDPTIPYDPERFEEAILAEHSVGEVSEWEHDYKAIAESKARITWRTGRPSRLVQDHLPHLLESGDTVFGGSAIVNGIVVGGSGVQPWIDAAECHTVGNWCQALAVENRKAADESAKFFH